MSAHSVYAAVFQNYNTVRIGYAGDALGDNELCGSRQAMPESFPDRSVCGGIHGAGAVVQYQNFRPAQKGPGDAEALLLAAGDIYASLAQHGIVTVRERHNKIVGAGGLAGFLYFLLGGIGVPPAEIIPDSAGEEHVFLQCTMAT